MYLTTITYTKGFQDILEDPNKKSWKTQTHFVCFFMFTTREMEKEMESISWYNFRGLGAEVWCLECINMHFKLAPKIPMCTSLKANRKPRCGVHVYMHGQVLWWVITHLHLCHAHDKCHVCPCVIICHIILFPPIGILHMSFIFTLKYNLHLLYLLNTFNKMNLL